MSSNLLVLSFARSLDLRQVLAARSDRPVSPVPASPLWNYDRWFCMTYLLLKSKSQWVHLTLPSFAGGTYDFLVAALESCFCSRFFFVWASLTWLSSPFLVWKMALHSAYLHSCFCPCGLWWPPWELLLLVTLTFPMLHLLKLILWWCLKVEKLWSKKVFFNL